MSAVAELEVLNGPDDGLVIPVPDEVLVLGPAPEALLSFPYDPTAPTESVRLLLTSDGVVSDGRLLARYGDVFQVGQVLLRLRRVEWQ